MDRDGISVQNSELVTSNQTVTHTITPSYKFNTTNKLNISIGGNIMMMSFIDNLFDSFDETATNTNFNTGSYTGTLGLRFDSPLTINMGGGISINSPEDINSTDTKFTVFTSKIGYKFLEKTMSTFFGVNIVSGNKVADIDGNGGIDNLKMTLKAGFQYKLSSNMSLGLNMDFISLTDNLVPDNDFTELKAKIKFKMGF
jgi:opacity protein-like surface antigen